MVDTTFKSEMRSLAHQPLRSPEPNTFSFDYESSILLTSPSERISFCYLNGELMNLPMSPWAFRLPVHIEYSKAIELTHNLDYRDPSIA